MMTNRCESRRRGWQRESVHRQCGGRRGPGLHGNRRHREHSRSSSIASRTRRGRDNGGNPSMANGEAPGSFAKLLLKAKAILSASRSEVCTSCRLITGSDLPIFYASCFDLLDQVQIPDLQWKSLRLRGSSLQPQCFNHPRIHVVSVVCLAH